MGGPKKEDKAIERSIAADQMALGREMLGMARDESARRKELQQPLVDFYKSILSGNPEARTAAAAVPIGEVTRGAKANQESIFENVPAGPGRDLLLQQNNMQKNSGMSQLLNSIFLNAFPTLASVGTEAGNFALQGYGGGFRGLESGSGTINNIMQADAQGKASTMGLFGGLAGAAGLAYGSRGK